MQPIRMRAALLAATAAMIGCSDSESITRPSKIKNPINSSASLTSSSVLGSKIAFTSDRDGNPETYVMNADGSDQRRLTSTGFNENGPAWSPNGQQIAFHSNREGGTDIYIMN